MSPVSDGTKYPYFYFKRFLDVFFSLILIVLTMPVVIFFSILIKFESPGEVFFTQERVGHLGKTIKIIKLRSMVQHAELEGAQWATKGDTRVTKVGSFIRKTRIDELPQLWNVLRGELSLIGPRPEREVFIQEFLKTIPDFNERLAVLPGLSGLAQVNGGYDISPEEKLRYDKEYIKNYSFKQDVKIAMKTISIIITGEGAR